MGPKTLSGKKSCGLLFYYCLFDRCWFPDALLTVSIYLLIGSAYQSIANVIK